MTSKTTTNSGETQNHPTMAPDGDNYETEDDEVKFNCITGVREGFHDSDLESTTTEDLEEDDEDTTR